MSDHYFWLSEAPFARLKPLLPNKPRGVPRVDDRRVISGIIYVIRGGADVARRARRLRAAEDPLQPLHPLDVNGRANSTPDRPASLGLAQIPCRFAGKPSVGRAI